VRADRLGDDVGDAPARVEARVRVLEDHLQRLRRTRRRAAPSGASSAVEAIVPDVGW
jgi:hypothetical protein